MKTFNSIRKKGVFDRSNRMLICFTIFSIICLGGTQAFAQKRIEAKKGQKGIIPGQYIVTFHDYIQEPGVVAERLAKLHKFGLRHVYKRALKGFSASMSEAAVENLKRDPDVALVEPDRMVYAVEQGIPTGIDRIDVDQNATAKIDNVDERVDVDVAIIDSGIDLDHPDLNVVASTNCIPRFPWRPAVCKNGKGDDDDGHGSHVAGIVAALDNNIGVVGVAPGARLWAVKVLDSSGSGYLSWIIAGIDWVTAHADQIEVANMSLGGKGYSQAARDAIKNAIDAGVVFVVAAGNDPNNNPKDIFGPNGNFGDEDDFCPACYPEVATISALCDTDGQPGGEGPDSGSGDPDDQVAPFSYFSRSDVNYAHGVSVQSPGAAIDLLMPGVDIDSTYRNGLYATMSGTSMASAHAAGLTALYMAQNGRDIDGNSILNADDVYLIRQALIENAKPQDDSTYGLDNFNDPDNNWEPIGWAGDEAPVADITDIAVALLDAPSSVLKGETVPVSVTVRNVGTVSVSGTITLSLSDETQPETTNNLAPIDIEVTDLAPGDSPPEPVTFLWETGAAAWVGDHILKATASYDFEEENSSNDSKSASVWISDPSAPTTMHIGDLDGYGTGTGQFFWFWEIWEATVTITVHDNLNGPVAEATVSGLFNDGSSVFTCTTNEVGTCNVYGWQFYLDCLTFTVQNVTHNELTYDPTGPIPDYDAEPYVNGTNITVCRWD